MEHHEKHFNILMSTCSTIGHRGEENLATDHVLAYRVKGESRTLIGDKLYVARPRSIALVRRNTLLKTVKLPEPDGGPFQSIAVFFSQSILKKVSIQQNIIADLAYSGEPAIDLSNNIFLKGYFDSLLPYFKSGVKMTEELAELKTFEAVNLLLQHNKVLRNMLFDFSEPFKIDLEAHMNRNYLYHIPLIQFARLSGRSLATFKRDFQKVFADSPERWIRHKRLERAHFLIAEQGQSPSAVYAEVGFETLSHFSVAFKKRFGYNPSVL
jgi:AraC-like DNA-binding protein